MYGIFTFLYTCKSIYLLQFLCVVSSYLYIFISTTESQKRRKSRSVSHLSVLKMKTKQKQTSRVAFTVCLGAHASSAAMLSSHGRLLSSSRRSLRISCTAVMSTVSLWSTPLNRPRRWRLSTWTQQRKSASPAIRTTEAPRRIGRWLKKEPCRGNLEKHCVKSVTSPNWRHYWLTTRSSFCTDTCVNLYIVISDWSATLSRLLVKVLN